MYNNLHPVLKLTNTMHLTGAKLTGGMWLKLYGLVRFEHRLQLCLLLTCSQDVLGVAVHISVGWRFRNTGSHRFSQWHRHAQSS